MIIILNGTSSSGKSTVAKAINIISPKPFIHIGIDTIYSMMPDSYINAAKNSLDGFGLVVDQNDTRPVKVVFGPYGQRVRDCSPKMASLFDDAGLDLIIDEVLEGDRFLIDYVKLFQTKKVYFVGVFCDLKTTIERELLRPSRAKGLAQNQFQVVHEPNRFYDLEIDTTGTSPFDCAKTILDFIEKNPNPKSMSLILQRLNKT